MWDFFLYQMFFSLWCWFPILLPALFVWFVKHLFPSSQPPTVWHLKKPDQTYKLANRLFCCTHETKALKALQKGLCRQHNRMWSSNFCMNSFIKLLVSSPAFTTAPHSAGDKEIGSSEKSLWEYARKGETERGWVRKVEGWKGENGVCLCNREREVITLC